MIKIFHSQQSGAPTCTGQVSKVIDILRACLINGYNTKTISTLTVTANVATVVTSTAHNYNLNEVIVISGANESVFNDSFRITEITDTTTFKFSVTTVLTEGTGTMSCKISPCGWEEAFTGTNIAVFRATEGTRTYVRMDDNQTLYAACYSYENMTGPTTGTNLIGSGYIQKSEIANATSHKWILIGNKRCFYIFIANHTSYTDVYSAFSFGDFLSYKPNDTYNYQSMCNTSGTVSYPGQYSNFTTFSTSNITNNYIGRRLHGAYLASQTFAKVSVYYTNGISYPYIGVNFPSPYPGLNYGITLFPVFILDTGYVRGKLSGIFSSFEFTNGKVPSLTPITDNNLKQFIPIVIGHSDRYKFKCFYFFKYV